MTLILDRGGADPRTHVFIAGVGRYAHLPGGTEPRDRFTSWGLEQLTSPPLSARAFADWAIGELRNPDAPLGTVELLLSPGDRYRSANSEVDVPVEAATMDHFAPRFEAWRNACGAHPDNVAIFFFSGHGIRGARLSLLLEDFGADSAQPFRTAVDFDGTHDGMNTVCPARTQVFFADACQQVTFEALAAASPGQSLLDADYSLPQAPFAPRFYATRPGMSAFAPQGQVSFYTQAVLESLRGLGSRKRNGAWEVVSDLLQGGIRESLRNLDRPAELQDQQASGGGQDVGGVKVNELPSPPDLPVVIGLAPDAAATEPAHLQVCEGPRVASEGQNVTGTWSVRLRAGRYDGKVDFRSRLYPPTDHGMTVHPQSLEHRWDVEHPDA